MYQPIDILATLVLEEYGRLRAEMAVWDSHFDEVAHYFVPRKDNIYGAVTKGEKKYNVLYDSEGPRAVDDLAAALATTAINPQSIWFALQHPSREINQIERVQKWLYNSTMAMIETFNGSNFQTSMLETFTNLVSQGTAPIRTEEDDIDTLRFYPQTIYRVAVDENNRGLIDVVGRHFCWTKRKILQEYSKDEAFKKNDIEKALGDDPGKEWEIIHTVRPRDLRDQLGRVGTKGMPWASVHVIKDLGLTIRESGFEENPYAVPRWTKLTEEKLGRSPAMKVLSDAKMLNEEKKVFIKGAQLRIGPPLQVPDQGFLTQLKLSPFSINYRRKGKDKVEPLFLGNDPGISLDLINLTKEDIRKGFFLDKLNVELGDRATATEVIQKRDENLRVLSPFVGRLDRELLRPIIDRSFGVMFRKGYFGTPPDELRGGEALKVKYMSLIARAQMIVESENFYRAISASEPMISSNPSILQNIDGDKVLRTNFLKFGNDPSLLRSEKQVQKMREQEQMALQQQADREQQLADAQTIKQVGEADAKQREAV